MNKLCPELYSSKLWNTHNEPLRKSLDAVFSLEGQGIKGIIIEYYHIKKYLLASGPAQIVYKDQDEVRASPDLPDDNEAAAVLGRAIQAIFSSHQTTSYISNFGYPNFGCLPQQAEDGDSFYVLFTSSGLFLFTGDVKGAVDEFEDDLETAAANICTAIFRVATSAHLKLQRATALDQDFDVFCALHKREFEDIKNEGLAEFVRPDMADILAKL